MVAIYLLGAVASIFVMLMFWYLYQSVRVIWQYNSSLAIAAIIFGPIVNIVFYFIPKSGFDSYERMVFKRYFMSLACIAVIGIFAAILIPSLWSNNQDVIGSDNQDVIGSDNQDVIGSDNQDVMAFDIDTILPWDWNIRAEDQEITPTQTEVNSTDITDAEAVYYDAIFQVHPDANSVMESPEFEAWLQGQPVEKKDEVMRILMEGTAAEVIQVFSNFKQDLKN